MTRAARLLRTTRTNRSTATNPNGQNFGNGITGNGGSGIHLSGFHNRAQNNTVAQNAVGISVDGSGNLVANQKTVEAGSAASLPVFVPGRELMGAIDIGGFPRFGPQSSANLLLGQDVYSLQYDVAHSRGRHLIKAGALAEHYRDDEFNPTFSLGIFRFANLSAFLRSAPAQPSMRRSTRSSAHPSSPSSRPTRTRSTSRRSTRCRR